MEMTCSAAFVSCHSVLISIYCHICKLSPDFSAGFCQFIMVKFVTFKSGTVGKGASQTRMLKPSHVETNKQLFYRPGTRVVCYMLNSGAVITSPDCFSSTDKVAGCWLCSSGGVIQRSWHRCSSQGKTKPPAALSYSCHHTITAIHLQTLWRLEFN